MAGILTFPHGVQQALRDKVAYRGQTLTVAARAAPSGSQQRKPLREGDKQPWYFTCTRRIPDVQHKVRSVVLWPSREAEQPRIIRVT